jgi:glycine/D-amino acid oxidase-like deaminating enzyme
VIVEFKDFEKFSESVRMIASIMDCVPGRDTDEEIEELEAIAAELDEYTEKGPYAIVLTKAQAEALAQALDPDRPRGAGARPWKTTAALLDIRQAAMEIANK